jgi:hypothetical protein
MVGYKRVLDYCLGIALMAAIYWYSSSHLEDPVSLALAKMGAVPLFLLAGRAVSLALGGESHTLATFRYVERHALRGLVWGSFWILVNWSDGATVQQAGRFFATFFVAGLLASIVGDYTKRREYG